jgi:hypothetical protein
MKLHRYKVPPLTQDELITVRISLKETICRWWSWRHDPVWRSNIREAITALRKLQRQEVV